VYPVLENEQKGAPQEVNLMFKYISIAIRYLKFMKKCIYYLQEPRNEAAQALSRAQPT
jgi:hypothetical protein